MKVIKLAMCDQDFETYLDTHKGETIIKDPESQYLGLGDKVMSWRKLKY